MEIICLNCSHKQKFPFEVYDYLGYVCPSCHAYYAGSHPDYWVYRKTFEPLKTPQWPSLSEFILVGNNHPCIITKIQRKSSSGISNEYVGLTKEDKDVFFSDGEDYYCILASIPFNERRIDRNTLTYNQRKYVLEETIEQTVVYAEGFVFEDLEEKSLASTYIDQSSDDRFISEEIINGEKEYYLGTYWSRDQYLSLFDKYRSHKDLSGKLGTKLLMIFIPLIILPALVFFFYNKPHRIIQTIEFNETFSGPSINNSFVSTAFELKGNVNKTLKYEGFSIPNQSSIQLKMSLVNERTNEVINLRPILHQYNIPDQNKEGAYANAIDIDFCRVAPGKYHLIYETSGSSTDNSPLKLEERIKLMYGGLSYMPLIVTYIALIIGVLVVGAGIVSIDNLKKYSHENPPSSIKLISKSGFIIFYPAMFLLMFGLQYFNERKSCESRINIDNQVDHTGTGSSRTYFRRSLITGSHK